LLKCSGRRGCMPAAASLRRRRHSSCKPGHGGRFGVSVNQSCGLTSPGKAGSGAGKRSAGNVTDIRRRLQFMRLKGRTTEGQLDRNGGWPPRCADAPRLLRCNEDRQSAVEERRPESRRKRTGAAGPELRRPAPPQHPSVPTASTSPKTKFQALDNVRLARGTLQLSFQSLSERLPDRPCFRRRLSSVSASSLSALPKPRFAARSRGVSPA